MRREKGILLLTSLIGMISILITGYTQGVSAINLALIFLVYVSLHSLVDFLLSKILEDLDNLEKIIDKDKL